RRGEPGPRTVGPTGPNRARGGDGGRPVAPSSHARAPSPAHPRPPARRAVRDRGPPPATTETGPGDASGAPDDTDRHVSQSTSTDGFSTDGDHKVRDI